jgi:hypothetical protein
LRLGQHQRQRPRPEASRKPDRHRVKPRDFSRGTEVADMGDQRIEGRPALGLVEPGNRRRVGCIRTEPVNGLGRERH